MKKITLLLLTKWLAIFGELDIVVPVEASINNIIHYMHISGNKDVNIALIPDIGHTPVGIKTRRLVRLDNLSINWINNTILK